MEKRKIKFQDWLKSNDKERKLIYDSWDIYGREGEEIVEKLCDLFRQQYKDEESVVEINYGIFHGGDWVISVAARLGHNIKFLKYFYGIRVSTGYRGLTKEIRDKIANEYNNDIKKFVDSNPDLFRKYFTFVDSPHRGNSLYEFVTKHNIDPLLPADSDYWKR